MHAEERGDAGRLRENRFALALESEGWIQISPESSLLRTNTSDVPSLAQSDGLSRIVDSSFSTNCVGVPLPSTGRQ